MCGCKHGKGKKLNNLDSKDHLKLASETYLNIVKVKTIEEMDDFDKQDVINVYMSLYPNQKIKPTLEQAVVQLENAHVRYTSK